MITLKTNKSTLKEEMTNERNNNKYHISSGNKYCLATYFNCRSKTNQIYQFKNNCPLNGPLYDDFRFASLSDGEVEFTTQIDCCWNKKKYAVYGRKDKGASFSKET